MLTSACFSNNTLTYDLEALDTKMVYFIIILYFLTLRYKNLRF